MILGATTWLRVPPRTAVALLIPFSFMPIAFYALMNKETLPNFCKGEFVKHQDIKYTVLKEEKPKEARMLAKILKVWPFASFSFLGNFSMQLSMTSILTTLTFPDAPFSPRDHYQYYRIVNEFGYVLGGTIPILHSCLFPKGKNLSNVQTLYVPSCFNVGCLILYLFASWYRFLPNVYILLGILFIHGIALGSINVNSVGQSASYFTAAEDKALALIFAASGICIGRLAAGLLGLFVERWLRKNCMNSLLLGRFCLARHISVRGWAYKV